MSDLFDNVKPGSRVHYLTPQGQTRSGTVVMNKGTHLVLNRGGGQPQVVTPKNYVKHSSGGKVQGALLSNLAKSMKKEGWDGRGPHPILKQKDDGTKPFDRNDYQTRADKIKAKQLPRTGEDEISDPEVKATYKIDPKLKKALEKKLLKKEDRAVITDIGGRKVLSAASIKRAMVQKQIQRQVDAEGIRQRKAQAGTLAAKKIKEELKIGDRVKLKKTWAGSVERNKIFTVHHKNADGDYWIGHGKSKAGWYVGDHQVKKIKEDNEQLIAQKAALTYKTKIKQKKKKHTLKTMKESLIKELDNSTLASYVTKALDNRKNNARMADMAHRIHTPERAKYFADKAARVIAKRSAGIKQATGKIASNLPAEPLAAHTAGEKSKHGGWSGMEARESEYRANQQLTGTSPRREPGHYLTRDGRTLSGPHSPQDAVRKYKDMSDSRNVKIVHVKEAVENKDKAKRAVKMALGKAKKGQTANVEPELNMPHQQTSQPMLQGAEGVPQNVRV
jgi:hypothetical protein